MTGRRACRPVGALSALIVLAAGCGRSHESSIGKGFALFDAGGSDKKIVFHQGDSAAAVVVDARVDRYTLDSNKIIAARRPRKPGIDGPDALSPECEYWIIDINTHVAHRIPDAAEWPEVHCNSP
jgi:hypothetical protein